MKNVNNYDDLQNILSDVIEEYNLDKVSVNSLLMSSFDFLEPELESASLVEINTRDWEKSKSVRLSNIQVDLKIALDVIFAVKPMFTAEGGHLILLILRAIIILVSAGTVHLSKKDAEVLFAIYRLQRASQRDIYDYLVRLSKENDDIDIVEELDIERSLSILEKVHAVELVDGGYHLNDIIRIKAS